MITNYRTTVEYHTWNLGLVAELALDRQETTLQDPGEAQGLLANPHSLGVVHCQHLHLPQELPSKNENLGYPQV